MYTFCGVWKNFSMHISMSCQCLGKHKLHTHSNTLMVQFLLQFIFRCLKNPLPFQNEEHVLKTNPSGRTVISSQAIRDITDPDLRCCCYCFSCPCYLFVFRYFPVIIFYYLYNPVGANYSIWKNSGSCVTCICGHNNNAVISCLSLNKCFEMK